MDRRTFLTSAISCGTLALCEKPMKLLAAINKPEIVPWIPGIVHCHSTFSDGCDNVPQRVARTKKAGGRFLILTDHYEQINSRDKLPVRFRVVNPKGVDIGFADYVRNCKEQTNSEFVCIPGWEIAAKWKAESDTRDESHTLALGAYTTTSDPVLDQIQSKMNTQASVIKRVNGLGMISIAAHPALISSRNLSITPWEWQRNRYDRRSPDRYAGIQGIEFFNSETERQEEEILEWYLSMTRNHRSVFVTAGCDSHLSSDNKDEERWSRLTWVQTRSCSQVGILEALRTGRTCASANGLSVDYVGVFPYQSQPCRTPKLQIAIRVPQPVSTDFVIYRDGIELVRWPVMKNRSTIDANWIDTKASPGEHWYVYYMKGMLITSPIVVQVK